MLIIYVNQDSSNIGQQQVLLFQTKSHIRRNRASYQVRLLVHLTLIALVCRSCALPLFFSFLALSPFCSKNGFLISTPPFKCDRDRDRLATVKFHLSLLSHVSTASPKAIAKIAWIVVCSDTGFQRRKMARRVRRGYRKCAPCIFLWSQYCLKMVHKGGLQQSLHCSLLLFGVPASQPIWNSSRILHFIPSPHSIYPGHL